MIRGQALDFEENEDFQASKNGVWVSNLVKLHWSQGPSDATESQGFWEVFFEKTQSFKHPTIGVKPVGQLEKQPFFSENPSEMARGLLRYEFL